MDWLSALRTVAPLAPAIGNIVGNFIPFPGASFMLQTLGTGIANALGVPATPEAVAQAASNARDVDIARINAAVEEQKARWAAGTERERAWAHAMEVGILQANLTMREELRPANRHWFYTGWRPAAGWIFDFYAIVFGAMICAAGVASAFYDRPQALDRLSAAWPLYVGFFATLAAMVGVYVWARTEDKKAGVDTTAKAAPKK